MTFVNLLSLMIYIYIYIYHNLPLTLHIITVTMVTHLVISTYDLCGIVLTLGATYYLVSCTHTRPSASLSTKQWFDDTILLSWMIRSHAVKTSQKNHSGLLCKNVCSTSPFIVLQHWVLLAQDTAIPSCYYIDNRPTCHFANTGFGSTMEARTIRLNVLISEWSST